MYAQQEQYGITKKYVAKGNLDLSSPAWEASCTRTRVRVPARTTRTSIKKYCCCSFWTHKHRKRQSSTKELHIYDYAQNRTPSTAAQPAQHVYTSTTDTYLVLYKRFEKPGSCAYYASINGVLV